MSQDSSSADLGASPGTWVPEDAWTLEHGPARIEALCKAVRELLVQRAAQFGLTA